jgi:hypothetical protein
MERSRIVVRCMRTMDTMLTAGCFVLAYFLKKHHLPEPLRGLTQEPSYYVILLLVIIILTVQSLFKISKSSIYVFCIIRTQNFLLSA